MRKMPAEGGWDVHSHLIPDAIVDLARHDRYDMSVSGGRLITPMLRIPLGRIDSPNDLTGWADEQGLTGALVSPPPPLFRPDLSGAERHKWASKVNESMLDACANQRLQPLAYLPAEEPRLATKIIDHLSEDWAGVCMGTDLGGLVYSDRALEPMWSALEERRLPVFIHPGDCHDPRLQPFYLTNMLGNPYETTVAAAHLVFGDVMGRHPALVPILAHGGGATASLVGRWQRGVETGRPGVDRLSMAPAEAVTRFKVDTVVHGAVHLRQLVDVFGLENILFGSDWPFPMGIPGLDEALDGLEASERDAVLRNNPQKTFFSLS